MALWLIGDFLFLKIAYNFKIKAGLCTRQWYQLPADLQDIIDQK
jgi:hypothetical protein